MVQLDEAQVQPAQLGAMPCSRSALAAADLHAIKLIFSNTLSN
jgi:hypothetical protein